MSYPDDGGLTAEGRSRRRRVRLQAAQMFAQDMDAGQIAALLRVSTKSVDQWRRSPDQPVPAVAAATVGT